ncbi:MAG: efflux RND transporter periplasmic adaptor subunit [Chthoniobacterales bacterium]
MIRHILFRGAIVAALLLAACSRPTEPTTELVRPVRTLVVAGGEDTGSRTFPGRVDASKQVELTFQVPGLLIDLPVREGQRVAQGDLVARLRPDEFQARLDALQGQLARARADLQALQAGARPEEQLRLEAQLRSADATLANARVDLDRANQLLRSQTISRLEFDRADTAFRVALENREAARASLDKSLTGREEDILAKQSEIAGLEARVVEAGIQLADTTLTAPYAGVIARRFVEQGQSIRAKQPVVKFQDVEEIEIAVDVPESVMASALRTADITGLTAEFSAAPGRVFPVQVREIAQRADPVTQTFNVRVAMQTPTDLNLLPGMTATVTMNYRRAEVLGPNIAVPVAAVVQDAAGASTVWIVGPDQTVTARTVRTGAVSGGLVQITEGLQPGDRIAAAGASHLREGMKVSDLGDALGGRP